jgi:transposase
MTPEEERAVQRTAKATSERVDVVKRARAMLAVHAGQAYTPAYTPAYTQAAREAGYQSGDSVSQLVERCNQQGLGARYLAGGRGRKVLYSAAQRECIRAELQRVPDRQADATATWSLKTRERALRKEGLPHVSASTIRVVLQEAGYRFGKTRTWCPTGTGSCASGPGGRSRFRTPRPGHKAVDRESSGSRKQWIEAASTEAEAAGLAVGCQDEAGPYQAIPQPGATWPPPAIPPAGHPSRRPSLPPAIPPAGHPSRQPHEYVRGGTAKLLTRVRPATGDRRPATGDGRAKGVLSASNAVLHPWLKDQLRQVLAEREAHPLPVRAPLPADPLLRRTWEHWWWSYERPKPAPPRLSGCY